MKRRILFVENFAKVEKVISQNLSEHCYSYIAMEHGIFMELEN